MKLFFVSSIDNYPIHSRPIFKSITHKEEKVKTTQKKCLRRLRESKGSSEKRKEQRQEINVRKQI